MLFPHQVIDKYLSSRLLKGLYCPIQKTGDIDLPDLNMTGENQSSQDDIKYGIYDLSNDKLCLTSVTISDDAGSHTEDQKWYSPNGTHKP